MFVLAFAFTGYFALLLYSDLTRPEPAGFVFDIRQSAMTLRTLTPDSPAARAGLEVGDRVLTANGRPIRNRLDWLSVETNLRVGRPLRLEVSRDGQLRNLSLVLSRAPWSYWTTAAGATLLSARSVQLVTLALALLVLFKRPFDLSARVGAWVLATLAVYSIVLPYQIAAIWRSLPALVGFALWIPFASSLAIASVIFTFFATFPRPVIRSRWAWLATWAPAALVLFLQLQFGVRIVYRPDQTAEFVDWTTINVAVIAGYTVAALAMSIIGYRHLTDLTQRRRVRVLVVGSLVGLLSLLPVVSLYWTRPGVYLGSSVFASPVAAGGAILGLALPVSFAYAILRHRLFDIDFIVRRGLQYALARRVLVSIVPAIAAIFLADLWMNRQVALLETLRARLWIYVVLAGLAVVARVQRNHWLDVLDRRFFRERHSAQRLLRGISADIRGAASLEAVASCLVAQIEAALHPQFVALFLGRPPELVYRAVATVPSAVDLPPLSSENRVVGLLRVLQKPIQIRSNDRAWLPRQLPPGEVRWLRRSNIELLVPVRLGGDTTSAPVLSDGHPSIWPRMTGVEGPALSGVEGLFALGPKRSEEPYSVEDEDLLMAIGNSLALVLAREMAVPHGREAFEDCPECGACYEFGVGRCPRDGAGLTVTSVSRLLSGRYRLDQRVARGGMGTVYAAFDTALERQVAVKLLRDDLVGGPGAAERFQSEARFAAGLTHPNVVTVHDIGATTSGRAFFVMELLAGRTLREELQHGRLTPPRVLRIMRGVSAAVEAAHQRQMIHRDLKPENIFLCHIPGTATPGINNDPVEIPKVLDFGLAKALEASGGVALTQPGLVAGTPQYMAPEHLRGDEPSSDWDLWALAVIAFEMITGVLPFAGAPGAPPRLDGLPAGLHELFSHALAVDPLHRPTSAQEFFDDLDRLLVSDAA
jgi:tRNA A-37 threonylcarbamoyl transferase component Bud32